MNAAYTQVVQKEGRVRQDERTDVAVLDAKFDEIYQRGGIYNFLSPPAMALRGFTSGTSRTSATAVHDVEALRSIYKVAPWRRKCEH
jgi:hypothetical protein